MEILERLKHQSEAAKRRYAFLAAIIATSIIGVGWSTTLPARFSTVSGEIEKTSDVISDLGSFFESSDSQLGGVGESIEGNSSDSTNITEDTYLKELSNPSPVTQESERTPAVTLQPDTGTATGDTVPATAPGDSVVVPELVTDNSEPAFDAPSNIILAPPSPPTEAAPNPTVHP